MGPTVFGKVSSVLLASLFISFFWIAPVGAFAAAYNFTVVATDGDIIGGHKLVLDQANLSVPAINNSGEVVFLAKFEGGWGIFSASDAVVVEGDTVAGHVLTGIYTGPGINADGTIVFKGGYSGGYGIFTQSELLFSTGQMVGDLQVTGFPQSIVDINDSGNVAVMVIGTDVNTGLSTAHVIDLQGTIAAPGDTIGGKTIEEISENPYGFVSINNADQVTFQAMYDGKRGIFSRSSFLTGEGESVEGWVITDFAAQTVITEAGDAVFIGVFCDPPQTWCAIPAAAVMTQDHLLVRSGQVVGGEEITGFKVSESPAVSGNGRLVFSASSTASEPGDGLFTPDGPVIRYPETIAGRPVNCCYIGPSSINDSGQIAFATRFADTYQWAIVRADPVDSDVDGIADISDNCTEVANPDQRDTDSDGYGNRCDGDFDNSGFVNFADLAHFKTKFGTSDPDADFDGNGFVNFADLATFKTLFGKAPGPSCCGTLLP